MLGGAVTYSERVFGFKNESSLIVGNVFERCFSFSTEKTSYVEGSERVVGSYIRANALHPDTSVVFSEDKGNYVVEIKYGESYAKFKDNKFINADGTDWQQPLFCCTTYENGFEVALEDAKSKVEAFEQAWSDVLVKLGLEAPKSSLVKCRNNS